MDSSLTTLSKLNLLIRLYDEAVYTRKFLKIRGLCHFMSIVVFGILVFCIPPGVKGGDRDF